jgi:ketosteroid isomerase-like protein
MEDVEFRSAGDDGVIALFRVVARARHTGIELERDDAIVYRIRGGRIARLEYFNDHRAALDAAGLQA